MRNSTKYGIFLVGTLSLLTLNALALSDPSNDSIKLANNSSDDSNKLANNGDEPVTISRSYSVIALTHEDLSNYSYTIVIGTVKEMLPSRWNTIDGREPDANAEIGPFNLIYTDFIVSVDKYLKNPLSSKEIIVRVEGGTVRNNSMGVEDQPSLKTGEKVLLYLAKDTNPGTKDLGPDHFVVAGVFQGKFTLTDDGKAVRPDENTTLAELLSSINQTNNNDADMSNNTGTAGKQEENLNSTPEMKSSPESKSAPLISSVWVLAAVLGAIMYVRRKN